MAQDQRSGRVNLSLKSRIQQLILLAQSIIKTIVSELMVLSTWCTSCSTATYKQGCIGPRTHIYVSQSKPCTPWNKNVFRNIITNSNLIAPPRSELNCLCHDANVSRKTPILLSANIYFSFRYLHWYDVQYTKPTSEQLDPWCLP
jgi:hypothetical protein